MTDPARIGLALGSGGAGGLAHIAMLGVFEELELEAAAVCGTSIGAILESQKLKIPTLSLQPGLFSRYNVILFHLQVSAMQSACARSDCGSSPVTWLDRIGIGISGLCLLQCLLLPLLLIFLPLGSAGLLAHEIFHIVVLGVILPVSLLAFSLGFLRHRTARMWWPAGAGLAILLIAALLEQAHVLGPWPIALLTSFGGVGLIAGHLINMRSRAVA